MDIVERLREVIDNNQARFEEGNKRAIEFYEEMKRLGIVKPDIYNIRPVGQGNTKEAKEITFLVR
jgi:hypothetical protein